MPPLTDPSLYPHHKPKNTVHEISTSSSLAFTSTLSSLLSTSSSRTGPGASSAPGRSRPSKTKEDIFATHNKNAKKRAAKDLEDDEFDDRGRRRGKDGRVVTLAEDEVDERALHRSKKRMEEKVRRYNELKRGGDLQASREGESDGLVDFDRKWAERKEQGKEDDLSSGDEEQWDGDGDGDAIVDFEDEYGRSRRGTKREAARMERRKQNRLLGAEELDRMSARPVMPEKLIYGDTVQTLAFNPDEEVAVKMEELAAKRDRSATPPEMKHYEAEKEFRIKGVGFYSFSKDEGLRKQEMENLERERVRTEKVRREREEAKEKRKREIEERRRVIGEKRARKQADSFLDGLGGEMEGKLEKGS